MSSSRILRVLSVFNPPTAVERGLKTYFRWRIPSASTPGRTWDPWLQHPRISKAKRCPGSRLYGLTSAHPDTPSEPVLSGRFQACLGEASARGAETPLRPHVR